MRLIKATHAEDQGEVSCWRCGPKYHSPPYDMESRSILNYVLSVETPDELDALRERLMPYVRAAHHRSGQECDHQAFLACGAARQFDLTKPFPRRLLVRFCLRCAERLAAARKLPEPFVDPSLI